MTEPGTNGIVLGRREFVQGVFAASALALLSGCSASTSGTATASGEIDATSLTVGITAPTCIDPYNAIDSSSALVASQLFSPLTAFDFSDGTLKPYAAASYAANDEATEFTFKLREARFHNGEDVDSRAFKRAWERMIDPKSAVVSTHGASSAAYLLSLVEGYDQLAQGAVSGLSGVSCPDERTLKVKLVCAFSEFPLIVSHPALAPVPQAAVDDPVAYFARPQGNGPYKLKKSYAAGESLTLVRYKGHFNVESPVKTIKFKIVEGADSAFKTFQAGELDISEAPIEQLRAAQSGRGLASDAHTLQDGARSAKVSDLEVIYLAFNTERAPLKNADVRRAISLSIDRSSLAKDLFRDVYSAATGIVPPSCEAARDEAWAWCAHDTSQAAELLDVEHPLESGKRDISLKILVRSEGVGGKLGEKLVSDLANSGIEAEIEYSADEDYDARRASGDFDLLLASWSVAVPAADSFLYPLFASASVGAHNDARFSSEEFDAKIAEARSAADTDQRVALYREAEDIVADAVPVAPLLVPARIVVASDKVARLVAGPNGALDLSGAELSS